jgi:hypothetical protein
MKKIYPLLLLLFVIIGSSNTQAQTYCTPSGAGDTWSILSVSTTGGTTNISNLSSGYSVNGYGDFTTMNVTAAAGGSFTMTAVAGALASFTYKWAVWIDYNNDGDFDDANETAYSYLLSSGINTMTATITVWSGSTSGNKRMRVRNLRDYNTNTLVPCGALPGNETEDYTLIVSSSATCAAPTAPTATSITNTSASLNWSQTGTPINYQIKYGAAGFNVNTAGTSIFTPTKPYTLNPPLTPGTSYDYYVRAICTAGDTSSWSPVTNFTTTICAAPTAPTATSITATTASLNWTQTGTPINYQIKYGAPGFNVNTAGTSIFTPTKPYTLNPPLTAVTSYSFYVRAICSAGDTSAWSPVANFTTISTCPPPTAPTATSITSTSASLNWTNAGTPLNYQIKYGAAGFNVNTAGTSVFTTTKPYTLNPPLAALTSYDYYVRIICSAGDTSSWSPLTNFTTLCSAPSVVSKKDSFRCGTGPVVLEATTTTGASIKWYAAATGGTALTTGNSYTTPSLSVTTTYYISAILGTCESSPRQAVVATIRSIPTVNLGPDTTLCPGISLTLNAGNAGGSYLWSPGGQTTQTISTNAVGQYIVNVTVNGCSKRDTILIIPGIAPVNNLSDTVNLCMGNETTLNAGNTGSTFVWTPGGATTQTLNVDTGGARSVVITSANHCKLTSSTYVKMRPLPVDNLGNDTTICESVVLVLNAGNPGYSYLWNTGATSQTINASDSGKYLVTITTPYSCVNKDSMHIAFLPEPRTEGFSFIPRFYDELGKVEFYPLNPTNVNSFEWDFGDGTALVTAVNPTHVFSASGHYNVTLKVYNDCTDFSLSQIINVNLTTGTTNINKDNFSLVIYPNPAKSVLNISNKDADYEMEDVMVFNAVGAMVYHQKADSKTMHQLSVESLSSGIYFVRVLTNKGFVNQQVQVVK